MNNYSNRIYVIVGIFILVIIIFIVRLFNLQIIDDTYKQSAENNSQRRIVQFPARGLIYDRNGELLVYNQAVYDLMITPRQVKSFDTLDLCGLLDIDLSDLKRRITKAKDYSYWRRSIFMKQLSSERCAVLKEKLYKYPGFFVQTRTLRKYPHKSAAHTLGYLQEVSNRDLKDSYYEIGDYIGRSGIEKKYEKELRGKKGVKVYWKDVYNRIKGSYKEGKYDKQAVLGSDIKTTIDIALQEYGELLMQNKTGGIVAIEPSTGEILAKITSPGYNPEKFVGREFSKTYRELRKNDSLRPLYDRTMGSYPPGSIFKMINALIGLQESVITPYSKFECHNGYHIPGFSMGCHPHASPIDLKYSIQHSCNSYYCHVFRNILESPKFASENEGYEVWRKHVMSFGLGTRLGADLPSEIAGFIPNVKYFQKKYRRKNIKALNMISMAIGQGELQITLLQMANMVSALANRGYYYTPHIVKTRGDNPIDEKYKEKHKTTIDREHFEPVLDGMELVVSGGYGSTGIDARIPNMVVCGKTGTVQNPHGDDHSVFAAFAPRENPQIAIVVYVEKGVWGSRYAAPIAGLMLEKYIRGEISESKKEIEKRMLEADLINQP